MKSKGLEAGLDFGGHPFAAPVEAGNELLVDEAAVGAGPGCAGHESIRSCRVVWGPQRAANLKFPGRDTRHGADDEQKTPARPPETTDEDRVDSFDPLARLQCGLSAA